MNTYKFDKQGIIMQTKKKSIILCTLIVIALFFSMTLSSGIIKSEQTVYAVDETQVMEQEISAIDAQNGVSLTVFKQAKDTGKTVDIVIGSIKLNFLKESIDSIGTREEVKFKMYLSDDVSIYEVTNPQKLVVLEVEGFTSGEIYVHIPVCEPEDKSAMVYTVGWHNKMTKIGSRVFNDTSVIFSALPAYSKYVITYEEDETKGFKQKISEEDAKSGVNLTVFKRAKDAGRTVDITVGEIKVNFNKESVDVIGTREQVSFKMYTSNDVKKFNLTNPQKLVVLEVEGFTAGKASVIIPLKVPSDQSVMVYHTDNHYNTTKISSRVYDNESVGFSASYQYSRYVIAFEMALRGDGFADWAIIVTLVCVVALSSIIGVGSYLFLRKKVISIKSKQIEEDETKMPSKECPQKIKNNKTISSKKSTNSGKKSSNSSSKKQDN